MIAPHPTTGDALDRFLAARRREKTPDGHLIALATGGAGPHPFISQLLRLHVFLVPG